MMLRRSIAGKVVDSSGRPLAAFVWAYGLDGSVAGMAPTDANELA
jgi:hypothetical protein